MSAKYKSPSFLLPNELNTSANTANDTGINSLYSMEFDGSSDFININSLASSLGSQGSFSAWVNVSDWSTRAAILGFAFDADNFLRFGVRPNNNNCFSIGGQFNNVSNEVLSDTTSLSENVWYHIVATSDGSVYKLYVNGQLQTLTILGGSNNGDWVSDFSSTADKGTIGSLNRTGPSEDLFSGKIDEVAIFNRALDSTEIAALYGGTSPNIYPSNLMATDLNPLAYYPLGEQAQMQGYLGNEASSEWQFPNGVLQDYVMDFDGTSPGDYISAPMTMLNSATQCTISFWGKKDASNKILCIGDQITNSQGIWLMWYSDGNIYFSPRGTGGSSFGLTHAQSYDNNWHHYLAVYNGSSATNCKLYLDGNLVATGSGTAPSSLPATTGDVFKIGALTASSIYSDGQISNVAVWNTAITDSAQIANIYNNGSPQTSYTVSPQNWWKLNADSVYTPSAPNYTTALDFVASQSDYIDAGNPTSLQITGELSISLWFKTSTTPTASGYLISKGVSPYTSRNFGIWFSSSNTVRAAVNGVSGLVTSPASNYNDDNWHHCVFTFTPSTSTILYIDGSAVATNTTSIPSAINNITSNLEIGKNVSEYFDGEISNVAVYNSALTSSQVSTLFNFGTPETAISFSPISWWKLDNLTTGLLDSGSASNNGTNNGAAEVPSGVAVTPSWKIPSALTIPTINYTTALDFDGSNNLINCGNDSSLAFTSDVSASAWIKTTEPTGAIIGKVYYRFEINNSRISWSVYRTTSIGVFLNSTSIVSDGKWHHIVVTHEAGGNARVYVDGQLEATATANTSILASTQDFFIGRRSATHSRIMDGSISNVQVWNTALTDGGISVGSIAGGQIAELYNNGQPSTTAFGSPVSWWKLDTGGSTITDYGSGGNNGTNNGAAKVGSNVYVGNVPSNGVSTTLPSTALQQSDLQFDSPYSNYSLYLDGTTGIQCGDIPQLNSATKLSFNVWLNYENMTQRVIFSKEDSTNAIRLYNWSSGVLYFWLKNSGSGTVSYVSNFSSLVNLNEWNMLTVVYDGTQTSNNDRVKIFLNGGSSNILTNYGAIPTSTGNITDSFAIGEYSSTAGNKFLGKLDETSIFNTVLTSAEMLEIYNNGRPKDLSTFSGTAPISWWRLGENAYFQDTTLVLPNSITGAPNGEAATNNVEMISADAPGTYANGIGTNLDILDRVGDAPLSTSNSQSYNMIPSDISPYVPQYVGNQISNTYSMTFDGINDYFNVGIPNFLSAKSTFTISLWFNTDDISSQTTLCMVGSSAGQLWGLSKFQDDLIIYGGSSTNYYRKNTLFNINTWYNLIVVYDGSQSSANRYKAYVNGSLLTSPTIYGTIDTITPTFTTDFNIGRVDYAAAGYFKGSIDEVAIWDTALNAGQIYNDIYQPTATGTNQTADIANNPNLPNPVAWYRMGD